MTRYTMIWHNPMCDRQAFSKLEQSTCTALTGLRISGGRLMIKVTSVNITISTITIMFIIISSSSSRVVITITISLLSSLLSSLLLSLLLLISPIRAPRLQSPTSSKVRPRKPAMSSVTTTKGVLLNQTPWQIIPKKVDMDWNYGKHSKFKDKCGNLYDNSEFRARLVRKTGIGGEVRHGVTSGVLCNTSETWHVTPHFHREYHLQVND